MPKTIKICSCSGQLTSAKTGRTFFVAHAETPNDFGGSWSTIRWTCISDKPLAVGSEVPLRIRQLDAEKGEGTFYVG